MTRKDSITKLREVLVNRREAIRRALVGDLSLLRELKNQTSADAVDSALDAVQDEISSQMAAVEARELNRIDRALEKMRSGEFGLCEGCGKAIPLARLQALPFVIYCVPCQEEAERNGEDDNDLEAVDWGKIADPPADDPVDEPLTDLL